MKSIKASFVFLCLSFMTQAQTKTMWWGGVTVKEVVNKSDLIFEGRILTDSAFFQNPPGEVYSYHRVLVLKQFKGTFMSDTITVITNDGRMILNGEWDGHSIAEKYAHIDDQALFFATNSTHVRFGGNDINTFDLFYGPGVSYVTVCDKKDVVKELYEPIEAVTGQLYVDVHPNSCKTQQKK